MNPHVSPTPASAVFARIYWMLLGPLLLILFLYKILEQGAGLSLSDAAYAVLLGGLPLGRWIEFRGGDPRTTTGDPSEPAHLKRYSITVIAVGLVAWGVIKGIGAS